MFCLLFGFGSVSTRSLVLWYWCSSLASIVNCIMILVLATRDCHWYEITSPVFSLSSPLLVVSWISSSIFHRSKVICNFRFGWDWPVQIFWNVWGFLVPNCNFSVYAIPKHCLMRVGSLPLLIGPVGVSNNHWNEKQLQQSHFNSLIRIGLLLVDCNQTGIGW